MNIKWSKLQYTDWKIYHQIGIGYLWTSNKAATLDKLSNDAMFQQVDTISY